MIYKIYYVENDILNYLTVNAVDEKDAERMFYRTMNNLGLSLQISTIKAEHYERRN